MALKKAGGLVLSFLIYYIIYLLAHFRMVTWHEFEHFWFEIIQEQLCLLQLCWQLHEIVFVCFVFLGSMFTDVLPWLSCVFNWYDNFLEKLVSVDGKNELALVEDMPELFWFELVVFFKVRYLKVPYKKSIKLNKIVKNKNSPLVNIAPLSIWNLPSSA